MRRARARCWIRYRLVLTGLAGVLIAGGPGCYPCYYRCDPGCAPSMAVPSTVRTGSICDSPSQVSSAKATVTEGSTRTTTVSGATPSSNPRVVLSQPSTPSRFSWRNSDPDASPAATTVEGAINNSSVNR
jgi:hypothetical protein